MTRLTDDGRVEFRFFRPNVSDVRIAGDFNQWDETQLAMHHEGSGWWTAVAMIDSGDHRFRYYADGMWFTDYAANGVEQSKSGWISVLTVPGEARSTKSGSNNTGKENAKKQNKVKLVA